MLVILAILAAVLVPTLLGWIDKARNSQITTNANAALIAAQALLDEQYGKDATTLPTTGAVSVTDIEALTDTLRGNTTWSATIDAFEGPSGKDAFRIQKFTFKQGGQTAVWESATGSWTVTNDAAGGAGTP